MNILPQWLKSFGKVEPTPKKKEEELKFRIAVTSGIYGAARGEDVATVLRKINYAITRGVDVIEVAADVTHEVDYTSGKEARYIAESQGITLNFHGELNVDMCIPDAVEWNNAQQHIEGSILSAVFLGARYVNFHSCLREWLELFTHAGQRLHVTMSDPEGNFIGKLFKNNLKLANWFVNEKKYHFRETYRGVILDPISQREISARYNNEINNIIDDYFDDPETQKKLIGFPDPLDPLGREITKERIQEIKAFLKQLTQEQKIDNLRRYLYDPRELNLRLEELINKIEKDILREFLVDPSKEWFEKERLYGANLEQAYYITVHDMFLNKDPIWQEMLELYKDTLYHPVLKQFGLEYNPDDPNWLENLMLKIDNLPDKLLIHRLKEFYYGVVAAKFLYSHLITTAKWMENDAKKLIQEHVNVLEPDESSKKTEYEKLIKILDNLAITIENPDARGEHAGRFLLWRPKQIYIAVKNAREAMKRLGLLHWDKVFMLIDFEHLSTQGADAEKELKELKNYYPITENMGEIILGVHSNVPNPMHAHKPIEVGDREVLYKCLWALRELGLGRKYETYIIYERGGFRDPFADSVSALRIIVKCLKAGIPPDQLPFEFYELPESYNEARQEVIIYEHTFDPLKGLLKYPEEEHTLLGSAAIRGGKQPQEWKKEELV